MPLDAEALAWITLSRAPRVGVAGLAPLLDAAGSAAQLLAGVGREPACAATPAGCGAYLRSAQAAPTAAEIRWLADPAHRIIGFTDPLFPPLLLTMRDCPVALYVRGNIEVLRDPQIAVVGSRNPTAGGIDNAFEFARYLATCGITITSGLAEGIDAAAHRGALAAPAATIAVLGTGIDVVYPRAHDELSEQIAATGALVSEFALQTPGRRANFPRRNRIIAALSLGTLIVEAARRSGSLITAEFACEQGREVFAIPGSIHNPLAHGCHYLLRQGATLIESADDILTQLNFSVHFASPTDPKNVRPSPRSGIAPMDKDHKILLDALGFEPTTLDELVVRSGFEADAVASMMLILELADQVQRAPAGRYARVARSS